MLTPLAPIPQEWPTEIVFHVLTFLALDELVACAEVAQDWREGSIPRIRACAAACIQNFEQFLDQNMSPDIRDHFFAEYPHEQFQIDSDSFVNYDGLRHMQLTAEHVRSKIEVKLLRIVPRNEIEKLDELQTKTFNFGFEKIFFLSKMRQEMCALDGRMREISMEWRRLDEHEVDERLRGVQQGFSQVIKELVTHRCTGRAQYVLSHSHHLRAQFDSYTCPVFRESRLENSKEIVDWRARDYGAMALGFTERGDRPAALRLANSFAVQDQWGGYFRDTILEVIG